MPTLTTEKKSRIFAEYGGNAKNTGSIEGQIALLQGQVFLVRFCFTLVGAVFAFLLFRSAVGLSPFRTKMKAMKIGIWEVVYGAVTVLSMIVGYYAGL